MAKGTCLWISQDKWYIYIFYAKYIILNYDIYIYTKYDIKIWNIHIYIYWYLYVYLHLYCISFHISDSAGTRDTFSDRIHVIDLWRGCGLTWLKSCFAAQETLTLRRTSLLLCLGWGLTCVHCGWSKIGSFFSKIASLARCACQLQVFAFHTPCLRASQGGNVASSDWCSCSKRGFLNRSDSIPGSQKSGWLGILPWNSRECE